MKNNMMPWVFGLSVQRWEERKYFRILGDQYTGLMPACVSGVIRTKFFCNCSDMFWFKHLLLFLLGSWSGPCVYLQYHLLYRWCQ